MTTKSVDGDYTVGRVSMNLEIDYLLECLRAGVDILKDGVDGDIGFGPELDQPNVARG